ncbi:MAG: addiction module protein [Planctomycetaceae bacterium]
MAVNESSIHSVFDLSPADKLKLVQDLWDDLASNPDDVPLYDWQIRELERREANLEKHPETALTWDEVLQRVRGRHEKK